MSIPQHVVIVGATSGIAFDTARLYAKERAKLTLVGRDLIKLEAGKKDLEARGAMEIEIILADFSKAEACHDLISKINFPVDRLIIAHGILGDQEKLLKEPSQREELFRINTFSVIEILSRLMESFKQQKSGKIAIISSVAGDRGRQSNFYYGSSKAALTAFASGLRNYLFPYGVHVMTVNPGFVATPMTAHLKQGFLFASSKKVASDIVLGLSKNVDVLYTPFFWRYIMLIIRLLPERLFKRLKL